MHALLVEIESQLKNVIAKIQQVIPNDEPLSIAHNAWNLPGVTRLDLIAEAQSLISLIDERSIDDLGANEPRLKDFIRRLQHLQNHAISHFWGGNAGQAVPAYLFTLNSLRNALLQALPLDDRAKRAEATLALRKLLGSIRSMEAQLANLTPRTTNVSTMVERIENAYDTAEQLPTDLESLSEARKKITDLLNDSIKEAARITAAREHADELDKRLLKSANDAQSVLDKSETAYAAATSVGLSAAFHERSKQLASSMWTWVAGLIGALAIGGYFGSHQLQNLSELLKSPGATLSIIFPDALLSLLSVGAPIWFAWLATKQIGQRFRLAEDYAFKASISRAYEGFRREAARFDKEMESRVLASALTRLDELPLRLVETETHGSPWHELASSDIVKQAMKMVPDFTDQIKNVARTAVSSISRANQTSTAQLADKE